METTMGPEVANADTMPKRQSLSGRLKEREYQLLRQLAEVQRAQKMLFDNPGYEALHDIIRFQI